jgi:diketogulonate reductase-like aldo/keto reductase
MLVIPSTKKVGRMAENLASLDFKLKEEYIENLNKFNRDLRFNLTFLQEFSK